MSAVKSCVLVICKLALRLLNRGILMGQNYISFSPVTFTCAYTRMHMQILSAYLDLGCTAASFFDFLLDSTTLPFSLFSISCLMCLESNELDKSILPS